MPAAARPIRLENVTLTYDRHPAVHHVSGTFEPGRHTAIVGPNGAGKTTLLKGLAGVLTPQDGHIDLGGLARSQIAYLPQQSGIDRTFPISVRDTVLLGHWRSVGPFGSFSRAQRDEADHALEAVGLHGFGKRPIGTLSAGQFQRVLFARLLLQDAPVILLDEPFNAIDAATVADLLALLHRWRHEQRTVIAVLHDLDQVRAHFEDALLLARECVAWGPAVEALAAVNRFRARGLAEGWHDDAEWCHRGAA
jgi:zinc/manganese transport system ATP-binding protein